MGMIDKHLTTTVKLLRTGRDELDDLLDGEVGHGLHLWAFEDFLTYRFDDDRTVIDEYLERYGDDETEDGRAYLEQLRDALPGVYEVVSTGSGGRVVLEDLLWERPDMEVLAGSLGPRVEPGTRLACRLVEVDGERYPSGAVLGLPRGCAYEIIASVHDLVDDVSRSLIREAGVEEPRSDALQANALRLGAFLFSSAWAAMVLTEDPWEPPFDEARTAAGMDRDAGEHGRCRLCGDRHTRRGMSRHLSSCLPRHDRSDGRARELLRLRIESGGPHWLDVEVAAGARLEELDGFLREIWLECCSHMSDFDFGLRDRPESMRGVLSRHRAGGAMKRRLGEMVEAGDTFEDEYDFGSTTRLGLRVVDSPRMGVCGYTGGAGDGPGSYG